MLTDFDIKSTKLHRVHEYAALTSPLKLKIP